MRADLSTKSASQPRAGAARKAQPTRSEEVIRMNRELGEQGKSRWEQFRTVTREMFGEKAFAAAKSGTGKIVDLGSAQLRTLASSPGKIEAAIKKLQGEGKLSKNNNHFHAGTVAKQIAKAAKAGLHTGKTFTVATINDDFTDKKTSLNRVNQQVNPDIMLLQEAKNSNLAKDAGKGVGVFQNRSTDDKAGSAVAWDKDEVKAGKRGLALGVNPPKGVGMLSRYMTFTDVKVEGRSVRMISVHRPPQRFKAQWPAFDRNLAAFVKSSPLPVIIGLDANERTPAGLAKATGLRWESSGPTSIDGFLVSKELGVSNIRRLDKGVSDHHPVVADFHWKK